MVGELLLVDRTSEAQRVHRLLPCYSEYLNALLSSSVISLIPPSMPIFSSSLKWPAAAASRSRFLFTDHMYTYRAEIMTSLTV